MINEKAERSAFFTDLKDTGIVAIIDECKEM
jgi:hypothetical protein